MSANYFWLLKDILHARGESIQANCQHVQEDFEKSWNKKLERKTSQYFYSYTLRACTDPIIFIFLTVRACTDPIIFIFLTVRACTDPIIFIFLTVRAVRTSTEPVLD